VIQDQLAAVREGAQVHAVRIGESLHHAGTGQVPIEIESQRIELGVGGVSM
jgi:hypothetical protein